MPSKKSGNETILNMFKDGAFNQPTLYKTNPYVTIKLK